MPPPRKHEVRRPAHRAEPKAEEHPPVEEPKPEPEPEPVEEPTPPEPEAEEESLTNDEAEAKVEKGDDSKEGFSLYRLPSGVPEDSKDWTKASVVTSSPEFDLYYYSGDEYAGKQSGNHIDNAQLYTGAVVAPSEGGTE